ncbi:MAG: TIR domain-containing protein, partial [Alphaproteobacteria bacterium]|nr:TIR domain-containing protein [Alphaproteobacteria bacterium]
MVPATLGSRAGCCGLFPPGLTNVKGWSPVPDVFISYKREERARCERIASKLRALGLDVWFDAKLEAGKNFDREIEASVAKSKAVLVLWSANSVDSQWVRNEAGFGLKYEKLVAARLSACDLPLAFSAVHYEDLFDPNFQDDDAGWLRLLDRISKLVGRPSIVSYSQALAQAALPLEAWARANAADPLARQIKAKADLLGGSARAAEDAEAPKRSAAPMVIAAIAALAVGAGVGAFAMRALGPVGEATAEVTSAAAPSPPT